MLLAQNISMLGVMLNLQVRVLLEAELLSRQNATLQESQEGKQRAGRHYDLLQM